MAADGKDGAPGAIRTCGLYLRKAKVTLSRQSWNGSLDQSQESGVAGPRNQISQQFQWIAGFFILGSRVRKICVRAVSVFCSGQNLGADTKAAAIDSGHAIGLPDTGYAIIRV